jgi:hypothetical protein
MKSNPLISFNKALKQYDMAHHLLHVTFPLVQDQKLLLGIIQNLSSSMELALEALLEHENEAKSTVNSNVIIAKSKFSQKHGLNPGHFDLITELKEIVQLHRQSPMEFQRGNRFVICEANYRMRVISAKDIQEYIQQAGDFFSTLEKALNQGK